MENLEIEIEMLVDYYYFVGVVLRRRGVDYYCYLVVAVEERRALVEIVTGC
jgi:hypothetical protein